MILSAGISGDIPALCCLYGQKQRDLREMEKRIIIRNNICEIWNIQGERGFCFEREY